MHLEIVSPEAVLFSSHVDSISVPGTDGEFQMLNNHAAVVSTLKEGTIKIHVHTQEHLVLDDLHGKIVSHADDAKVSLFKENYYMRRFCIITTANLE